MKKFFFILRKISLITVIFIFFISILIIIFDMFILTPDFTETQIKSFFLKNYNLENNISKTVNNASEFYTQQNFNLNHPDINGRLFFLDPKSQFWR